MATHKTIQISRIDNDYHWKPFSEAQPTETAPVPSYLFDEYIETRTKYHAMRQEIETYFPKKVEEGQTIKFN